MHGHRELATGQLDGHLGQRENLPLPSPIASVLLAATLRIADAFFTIFSLFVAVVLMLKVN